MNFDGLPRKAHPQVTARSIHDSDERRDVVWKFGPASQPRLSTREKKYSRLIPDETGIAGPRIRARVADSWESCFGS